MGGDRFRSSESASGSRQPRIRRGSDAALARQRLARGKPGLARSSWAGLTRNEPSSSTATARTRLIRWKGTPTPHRYRLARQGEVKCRAVVQLALGANGSTMSAHHVLGDRQAQASATRLARPRLVHPIESLEQSRQMFAGNTAAKIAHKKLHALFRFAGPHQHLTALSPYFRALSIRLVNTW